MSDEYDPTDPKWDSDEALENLKMERSLNSDLSNADLAKKLLDEASPFAAQTVIHLALHAANENTRLNAAKYITDKLYDDGTSNTKPTWEKLIGNVVSDAEVYANQGVSSTRDPDVSPDLEEGE